MTRLRIQAIIVQAVLVYDDGDELTPGPQVNSITLPLSKVADYIAKLPAEVAALDAAQQAEAKPSD